jgi:hypothetical protein
MRIYIYIYIYIYWMEKCLLKFYGKPFFSLVVERNVSPNWKTLAITLLGILNIFFGHVSIDRNIIYKIRWFNKVCMKMTAFCYIAPVVSL